MEQIISYISENPLQILGTVIGFIYLIQEIKTSKWMWLSSVIMPVISLFVYFKAGLYADFAIDIYYVIIAIYGYWCWTSKSGKMGSDPSEGSDPSHTPRRYWLPLICAAVVLFFAIRGLLIGFTDSTVPSADSFTTTLSIIAMFMLARKWIEQWWVWAVVDAVSTCLYFYKGIHGYAVLYAVYTVLAFYGYARWAKKMKN